MNSRRFRAPRFPSRVLVAGLVAALASGAGAQTPDPAARGDGGLLNADVFRQVKVFDFDERPLGNFEETPMHWTQFEGPGLPSYSEGAFDYDIGHEAPPSFRFWVRGGSIGYEYAHTDLVIFPDSDYLIEGFIRTGNLEHARAFMACYLVDRFGQRVPGSDRVSALVGGADPDDPWQRVTISLPGDYPEGRSLRLQLWILQRHVWRSHDLQTADPIVRQDVDGYAWFDDIRVHRMPRIRFGLSNPGGLVLPGERGTVLLDVHNATLAEANVDVSVVDGGGRERSQATLEVAPQVTRAFELPLPELEPGLYTTQIALLVEGDPILQRTHQFAVLPPMPHHDIHEIDLGLSLGRWPDSNEYGVVELAKAFHVGAVKVGLPMVGAPKTDSDVAYLRQIANLARELASNQIQTTAVILSPFAREKPDPRAATWRLVQSDDNWNTLAGPVFAYFGGYLMSWQLGDERIESLGFDGWNANTVQRIRSLVERFIAAPELILPRSILDTDPASTLPGAPGDLERTALDLSGLPLHAHSYWVPPEIPARSIPWALAFWFEKPRVRNTTSEVDARTVYGGTQRWLTLGVDRSDNVPREQLLADTARRVVLAKAVNPDRLYIPAPFELAQEAGGTNWQPTYDYIPLRTLFHHLAGQRAVAALLYPHDGVGILFSSAERHTLVLWTWAMTPPETPLNLYAGAAATAMELSGQRRELVHEGALVKVPLSPMPLIVENVDAPLILLQDSFRVEPSAIQLHDPEPPPVLKMENYYAFDISGTIELHPPKGWAVEPNPIFFELPAGEMLEKPLTFTIPPRQIASVQPLGVDVHLSYPNELDLHFDEGLKIELRDIYVRGTAWWDGRHLIVEQTLHNMSAQVVSFSAFCQALNRPQAEGAFLNVPPGDVRVLKYRIPDARDLAGTKLWMGIQEIDGRRTLDQLVDVPY